MKTLKEISDFELKIEEMRESLRETILMMTPKWCAKVTDKHINYYYNFTNKNEYLTWQPARIIETYKQLLSAIKKETSGE